MQSRTPFPGSSSAQHPYPPSEVGQQVLPSGHVALNNAVDNPPPHVTTASTVDVSAHKLERTNTHLDVEPRIGREGTDESTRRPAILAMNASVSLETTHTTDH